MAELMEGMDRPALEAGVDQAVIRSAFGAQRQPHPQMAQEQARRAEEPRHQVDPPPQEGDRPESSLRALALRIQGRVFNMDAAARAVLRA